jgi:hypothetical protein
MCRGAEIDGEISLSYEMEVTFRGNHVEARSIGEKNYQTAERLWAEITRVCNEHTCYRVLGIAESDMQMSVMDAINHEELFKKIGVTPKYKIAWTESNRNEFDKLKNLETILLNRGFRGKVFTDVEEARAWLTKD